MKSNPTRIFRLVKVDTCGRYEWLHVFVHDGTKYILDHFMHIEDGNYSRKPKNPDRKCYPDELRVPLQDHIDKYKKQKSKYKECTYTEISEEEKFMIFLGRL